MPAVAAIASAPQKVTRAVALRTGGTASLRRHGPERREEHERAARHDPQDGRRGRQQHDQERRGRAHGEGGGQLLALVGGVGVEFGALALQVRALGVGLGAHRDVLDGGAEPADAVDPVSFDVVHGDAPLARSLAWRMVHPRDRTARGQRTDG